MHVSNHKKLVDACYVYNNPGSGSGSDFPSAQPDPNALSRLSYYCSTRPHKIVKVSAYLLSYARAQALPSSLLGSFSLSTRHRHSKPGLLCTLQLFGALLRASPAHLPRILPDLLSLLSLTLGFEPPSPGLSPGPPGLLGHGWVAQEAELALGAIELFALIVANLGPVCLLDQLFLRALLVLLARFSALAMVSPSVADLTQPLSFPRTLAFVALGEAVRSTALRDSPQFDKQVMVIVPGLLAAILPDDADRPFHGILAVISQLDLNPPPSPCPDPDPDQLDHSLASLGKSLLDNIRHPNSTTTECTLLRYSLIAFNLLLAAPSITNAQYTTTLAVLLTHATPLPPSWMASALVSWTREKFRPLLVDALLPHPTLLCPVLHHAPLGPLNVLKTLTSLVNHILNGDHPPETLIAAIGALASSTHYPSQSRDMVAHLLQHAAVAPQPTSLILALRLVLSHQTDPECLLEVLADTLGSLAPSPELESTLKSLVERIGPIETRSPSVARFISALVSIRDEYLEIVADKRWIELLLALPSSSAAPACWPVIACTWELDPKVDMIAAVCGSETVQKLSGLSNQELVQHFLGGQRLLDKSHLRRHDSIRSVPSPIKPSKGAASRLKSLSISELRNSMRSSAGSSIGSKHHRRRKEYQKELLSELELVVGSTGPRLVIAPPYEV